MLRIRHILLTLAATLMMAAMASCGKDDSWLVEEGAQEVVLSVTLMDVCQHEYAKTLPDIEKIDNYIILITDEDGKLKAKAKGSNAVYGLTILNRFKATLPETIKVYAIANYGMVEYGKDASGSTMQFESWKIGDKVDDKIESCVFSIDTSKGKIPLFGYQEVNVKKAKADYPEPVELNMVRVATKFEFNITNNRSEDITVTDLTLRNLADRQYLKPHFKENYGVISNTGKHPFYFGPITDPFATTDGELPWDVWLAKAVEESHEDINDENVADIRGWIMEYNTPEDANHERRSFAELKNTEDISANKYKVAANSGSLTLDTHYYAESAYLIPESLPELSQQNRTDGKSASKLIHDDAKGRQQYYYFSITFTDSDGKPHTFLLDFYNLRALFRNTDVKVDITVGGGEQTEVEWRVYTRNWHVRIQPEIVL